VLIRAASKWPKVQRDCHWCSGFRRGRCSRDRERRGAGHRCGRPDHVASYELGFAMNLVRVSFDRYIAHNRTWRDAGRRSRDLDAVQIGL